HEKRRNQCLGGDGYNRTRVRSNFSALHARRRRYEAQSYRQAAANPMTDVQREREEDERYLARRQVLAKRFGWWWWDPAKALRGICPDKTSDEAIRKGAWPEFECAAFNYELASRHNGRRRYLLGKRFDRLTPDWMFELMGFWPRKWLPLRPIEFLSHAESPD